ncbi:sigma-70 family RNA polymerase sigma factor [Variovorax sp. J22R133]|uniref:RNA polymerase sigma factor n=1 Tax=Variovorax brevis TaxID=3053503 RepID=UPI0025758016|nr:sigma-70 family RNA polymerase sigma factor [Variovorax sp. J22R133]MDM0112014.1 sigma-70 family RNA polymerase sigma factor [Variovorax sp. J22R133]
MSAPSLDAELMALIDRVGQRDETALRLLYDRTAPRLLGLAMRVVRQREWAEDVLQESFLTIWRVAGDYRSSLSPPLAWMGLIVRSRSLDLLRRRSAERAQLTQDLDETMADALVSDAASPMDAADASEQAQALHRCLQELDGRQREVVSLAWLHDMSHVELAGQLALPLGTVKTWIRRALEKLRNCMKQFA